MTNYKNLIKADLRMSDVITLLDKDKVRFFTNKWLYNIMSKDVVSEKEYKRYLSEKEKILEERDRTINSNYAKYFIS